MRNLVTRYGRKRDIFDLVHWQCHRQVLSFSPFGVPRRSWQHRGTRLEHCGHGFGLLQSTPRCGLCPVRPFPEQSSLPPPLTYLLFSSSVHGSSFHKPFTTTPPRMTTTWQGAEPHLFSSILTLPICKFACRLTNCVDCWQLP